MPKPSLSRRSFLAASGVVAGGVWANRSLGSTGRTETVRCGFVGVGNRGTALLRSTTQLEGVEIVAVCDVDEGNRERAGELVQKASGTRVDFMDDWKKLLKRADVTAVISALPCDLHYAAYRDALAAGKHVYGEKPMCLTVEHANALVKQSREVGVVFQIGFQRRFSEQTRNAVKFLQEGTIGKPFEGRGVRYGSGGPHRKPGEWFSFRERSGDWMLEQAVHNFDVFNWALKELPVSAFGAGRQDLFKDWDPQRNVSDFYTATLEYKNGLILSWSHTWMSPPHPNFTLSYEQLVGPKGAVDLGKGFVAYRKDWQPAGGPTQQLEGAERPDLTKLALADFFDCVRTGRSPAVGAEEGRDATLVGLLVRKAVYERRLVTMDEILKEG